MISPVFLWIPALVLALAGLTAIAYWAWKSRSANVPRPLPLHWQLSARPVFSTDERRIYRLLREALPNHAILSKLPLVRFTQPDDPNEVRYWYELLGTTHVAFAICSANGRVLAAIDLDTDRGGSRRTLQIKQAVLAACRVRYLRCPIDNLPTIAELQLLVPQGTSAPRHAQSSRDVALGAAGLTQPEKPLPAPTMTGMGERNAVWQDSNHFDDSFFALENRPDVSGTTDFGGLGSPPRSRRFIDPEQGDGDDIAGIVSDDRRDGPRRR